MRQQCNSRRLPRPPDGQCCHTHQAAARSSPPRQRSCPFLLLLMLALCLPVSTLGAHVHASRQMRDHIQQVIQLHGAYPEPCQLQKQANHVAHLCRRPPTHMVALTPLAVNTVYLSHPLTTPSLSAGAHMPALQWASQLLIDRDYVGDMPDQQRVGWGQDLGLSINQTLTAMQLLKVPITVDVKLVGFAGDG